MKKHGCFVISLDFEMMWGGIDCWGVDDYGTTHIANVRDVIKKMTCLFDKYNIHATFATVGLLMNHNKKEAINNIPTLVPSYIDTKKSPFHNNYIDKINEKDESLFFATDLIELLKASSNIEIGSHTYCHYYCWEEGQTIEQFNKDIEMACKIAVFNDIQLKSIIFPRNQVSDEYLNICSRHGILTYRGNPKKYFEETTNIFMKIYNRASRLLDTYINWGGQTTIPIMNFNKGEVPLNIPASRMLRPYIKKLHYLEPLRKRRIKMEMLHAAKNNELYHLWWHPHNFGSNTDINLSFLEDILKYYQECNKLYGMQSYTMKEFYQYINS